MSVLVHDYNNPTNVVHYPGDIVAANRLDESELDILRRRGALTLPPRDLCDDLVKAYFKWVAPMVPIINRKRFMEQYRDPKNPPSLLLLQAVCLAGSRACTNDQLKDPSGSKMPAIIATFKRVRALYEAHYEDDRVTIVQSLILVSMFWERTGTAAKNAFYWNGLAISIAHGFGMHRNAEESKLSGADKRLWRRIWWTLFTRDRSAAVAFGRPVMINMDNSDVEMVSEDDFLDDHNTQFTNSRTGRLQVQFFLQYVKLCQVMDLIFLRNYSIEPRTRQQKAMDLTECVMKLSDWLQNCPEELKWEQVNHNFWSAQLSNVYHATNCLLHRAHIPVGPECGEIPNECEFDWSAYHLRSPIFQCARAITHISESLVDHNELRYTHPFLYVP
jgi:Fungal specific transcription factor domain